MDFTRQPIIITVITPKEGCKIVVRSSKNAAQEEYFVDAVEVVSFGEALFFRSIEKPKPFLVPVNDYEILEVREARMVFKNVGIERTIKIGSGKELPKGSREGSKSKGSEKDAEEPPREKKREKRRQPKRRRQERENQTPPPPKEKKQPEKTSQEETVEDPQSEEETMETIGLYRSTLLAPPPTLISETLSRYRDNEQFKEAFYDKDEEQEFFEPEEIELPEEELALTQEEETSEFSLDHTLPPIEEEGIVEPEPIDVEAQEQAAENLDKESTPDNEPAKIDKLESKETQDQEEETPHPSV